MSQREANACNEIEKEGSLDIIDNNFGKIFNGLSRLAWVRVFHEKVFEHVNDETDFHDSVKDG